MSLIKILAAAPTLKADPGSTPVNIPAVGADTVLSHVLNMVYFFGGAVCVIVIIIGGILYATSGGDSSKVVKAKNAILYAIVGLVVIMMAFALTGFVAGRV